MEANKASTLAELLAIISDALDMLKFDRAELHLKNMNKNRYGALFSDNPSAVPYTGPDRRKNGGTNPKNRGSAHFSEDGNGGGNPGRGGQPPASTSKTIFEDIRETRDEIVSMWTRGYYRRQTDAQKEGMMKIDLPLHENGNGARVILLKDLSLDPLNYFTIRRLEQLRRTLRLNLTRLQKK